MGSLSPYLSFFTFSLMASWTITASVLMAKTTSDVRTSVSKYGMSWFRAASKYVILILVDCLSPLHIQHAISATKISNHPRIFN